MVAQAVLGCLVALFGFVRPDWPALVAGALTVVGIVVVALLEMKSRRKEAWLVDRYTGYEAYRRRVRWWFVPGIR